MPFAAHAVRCSIVACALLSSACVSDQLDATDRQAFYFEARARKQLMEADRKPHTYLEGAWTKARGNTTELDYSIDTVNVGYGVGTALGVQGWSGAAAGVSLQRARFDSDLIDTDGDTGIGTYGAIEGGFHASAVIEPLARIEAALYLRELSSMFGIEAGVRFHVVEHGALFAGWRYTRYNFREVRGGASVDEIDLDSSGLALGLSLSF